jgi:iron complex outermembrane receptor protein
VLARAPRQVIRGLGLALGIALGLARAASAQPAADLKRMSLEELMNVEVVTFSRASERSVQIPAAVFVITQDDIRRSGATSLPEALRLAPGLQIARQDAVRYAMGTRGFADRLSRSMLVLIDGRAVYNPLFAGTYWEVQDTLLEDIDRIEVIRGPGGTLWGANAVNGIINILTKHSRDTQGLLLTGAVGNELAGPVGVRYGGSVGDTGQFRFYAKGVDRDPQFHAAGADFDSWQQAQVGVRSDWSLQGTRTLTLQGDVYTARLGQRYDVPSFTPPYSTTGTRKAPLGGGNVVARWAGPARGGEFQLQSFYDRTRRDELPVGETRQTFDLDWQYRHRLAPRHNLIWGAGYRLTSGRIESLPTSGFDPTTRTDNLFTAFAQDDVQLRSDRLRLIAGTKVEHNAYSGFEIQPSARLVWNKNASDSLFAAVTRAVRTPSRVETDYTTISLSSPAVPAFVLLRPNPGFVPEKVIAYELGYRFQPFSRMYATASAFVNQLEDVLSTELLTPFVETTPPPARLVLPVTFANTLHGNSHGAELTMDWRTTSWLRTTANYSYLQIQLSRDPGSADVSQERRGEGQSPNHQVQAQASLDLPSHFQFDWIWRYVSTLPAAGIPAYNTSDARLGWQVGPGLEIALVGKNLHDNHHLEWPSGAGGNVQIQRSVYVGVTWRQ